MAQTTAPSPARGATATLRAAVAALLATLAGASSGPGPERRSATTAAHARYDRQATAVADPPISCAGQGREHGEHWLDRWMPQG